jgi:hypothetical protein
MDVPCRENKNTEIYCLFVYSFDYREKNYFWLLMLLGAFTILGKATVSYENETNKRGMKIREFITILTS